MKLILSAMVLALAGARLRRADVRRGARCIPLVGCGAAGPAWRSDPVAAHRHGGAAPAVGGAGDISPALPAAVLQAEDQRFYEHNGVDWSAAAKAAWDNLFRSRPRGASTITMQLAACSIRLCSRRQGRSWGRSGIRCRLRASWMRSGASSRSWKPT
jgi:penicillin-binding protein 1C